MTEDDKALVERLRAVYRVKVPNYIDDAADRIEALILANQELRSENDRLREAGKDLGFYAGHDDSCDCVKGWAKGPCNCGYTETWKHWSAALGETK